jgi:hypothetical protein
MGANDRDSAVRLKYEPQYDLLSVWLGAPQPVDQVEVEPGVYVRFSRADHQPVGIEVLEAVARLHTDPETIRSHGFAKTLVQKYAQRATSPFSPALASPVR